MKSNLFIENSNPKVLTPEEVKEYFTRINNGDIDAKKDFINHNIKLVILVVNKYYNNTKYEKDDLISIGFIGLIKATNSYDINKGILFSTFATRCITNEILMYLRKNNKHLSNISMDQTYNTEDSEFTLQDTISDDTNIENDYENKITLKYVKKLIAYLSPKEQTIIKMYFGLDGTRRYNQIEIASYLKVTQSYASRLIKRILLKLQIILKSYDKNVDCIDLYSIPMMRHLLGRIDHNDIIHLLSDIEIEIYDMFIGYQTGIPRSSYYISSNLNVDINTVNQTIKKIVSLYTKYNNKKDAYSL